MNHSPLSCNEVYGNVSYAEPERGLLSKLLNNTYDTYIPNGCIQFAKGVPSMIPNQWYAILPSKAVKLLTGDGPIIQNRRIREELKNQ